MTTLASLTDPSVSAGPGTEQAEPSVADAPGTGTPSVANVLRQAADLIETGGWWQGDCSTDVADGGQCASTAIREVAGRPGSAALDALIDHLGFGSVVEVFRWNDAAKSASDVTSKLREAADAVDS